MSQPNAMPTAIRSIAKTGVLEIDWDDDSRSVLSHEYLRVTCPCADCTGHTPDQAKVIVGKQDVRATLVELVGNYAIRIVFDDGHSTGIYTFEKLYRDMK